MLDRDGDQSVTKQEWMDKLCEVGRTVNWDADTMEMMSKYGEQFFTQMDTDKNGILTYKEFKENLKLRLTEEVENFGRFREVLKISFKNPKVAFDMLDRDGDQLITREEWIATLGSVGEHCGWQQSDMEMMECWGNKFFDQMDTNSDGELCFKEFKENLKRKLESAPRGGS